MRYIESDPVRLKLVGDPGEYQWSSYRANALGDYDSLVKAHEIYAGLGATPLLRQQAYRRLFDRGLSEEFIMVLRAATNGAWPLGSDRFKQRISEALGRRVVPLSKGRPPRPDAN
jgi:putative transposase